MGLSGKFHDKFCCVSVIARDKRDQFALAVFDNCLNAEIMKGFDVTGTGKEIRNHTCCGLIRIDICRTRPIRVEWIIGINQDHIPYITNLFCCIFHVLKTGAEENSISLRHSFLWWCNRNVFTQPRSKRFDFYLVTVISKNQLMSCFAPMTCVVCANFSSANNADFHFLCFLVEVSITLERSCPTRSNRHWSTYTHFTGCPPVYYFTYDSTEIKGKPS